MIRIAATLACTMGLSACATLPDWVVAPTFLNAGATADVGHYSFDWNLSGDRQLAPLQVFDNGKETWLQFMPEQFVPAIFRRTQNGKKPLTYTRRGDYLIIDGVWPELIFRGGTSRAVAQKRIAQNSADLSDVEPSASPVLVSEPVDALDTVDSPDTSASVATPLSAARDHRLEASPSGAFTDDVGLFTDASFKTIEATQLTPRSDDISSPHEALSVSYGVRLQDLNLRKALHRWALQARWTFAPEHWAVDVDIPVSGEAVFNGPFQDAVQDLLSATELAERPLRPCFYSNRVLRVVSYSQSCDRSGGRES